MNKDTLKSIFNFLERKDNRKTPFLWKVLNNESFTEEELNIKGDLDLSETVITSLPNGLKIGGDLDLIDCSNLTSLPEGLEVGGDLDLENCTNLTSLPEGLKVGGELDLENCTNLTSLPKGLKVGGWLIIRKTQLKNYTDDELREMVKPGFIKGNMLGNI
jgi:hypothetical protein